MRPASAATASISAAAREPKSDLMRPGWMTITSTPKPPSSKRMASDSASIAYLVA
jgi:hypothetical protein